MTEGIEEKRHEVVSYCDHIFKTEQPGRVYPQKIKNEFAGVVAKWPEERLDKWIRRGIDEQTGFRIQDAIDEGKELWEEFDITEEQLQSLRLCWRIERRRGDAKFRPAAQELQKRLLVRSWHLANGSIGFDVSLDRYHLFPGFRTLYEALVRAEEWGFDEGLIASESYEIQEPHINADKKQRKRKDEN